MFRASRAQFADYAHDLPACGLDDPVSQFLAMSSTRAQHHALYEEFSARGVLSRDIAVQDTEWGTQEFGFRDPDGNGLTFFCDR